MEVVVAPVNQADLIITTVTVQSAFVLGACARIIAVVVFDNLLEVRAEYFSIVALVEKELT